MLSHTLRRQFTSIGFIGLGNMGYPMALNLKKNGLDPLVFDNNPEKNEFLKKEFRVADSIKDIAQNSQFVITMLPNANIIQDACLGENGLFKNLSKHSVVCDSSTIPAIKAKELSKISFEHGVTFLDAPVSGGVFGAQNGTLTFMLGCAQNIVAEKCEAILIKMGKKVFLCGSPGSGQIAKMCNNTALAIQMASIAEALALGNKMGIDMKLLSDIMGVSTAGCWSLNVQNPHPGIVKSSPGSNNYEGGFISELMLKDLLISHDSAKASGLELEFLSRIKEIYEKIVSGGDGKKDFGIIYKWMLDNKL